MGGDSTIHGYPDRHLPGNHWATDEAWRILDILPVNTLDMTQRCFIAGLIAGALMKAKRDGEIRGFDSPD